MGSKSFEELVVWQKAHKLVLGIYATSRGFPKEELFALTSQIRRAAVSIPSNIAEGFKRSGKNDKLRFYNTAQGSIEECRYQLVLAHDLGYADMTMLRAALEEVSRLLESYMASLRNSRFAMRCLPPFYWLLTTGYWLLSHPR